ncbi:MAG: outer membrane beta-barrel protein [Gloeobacteraceae cyanobacterium ES-bin-316]|nr:outer membrane beta-barrel protein [Ferruginibacter sp.]
MRILLVIIMGLSFSTSSFAQEVKEKKTYDLANRASDHFMVQFALNSWQGAPDSISSYIGGFNRSANVYIMLDKPFKSNPRLSIGAGVGIGSTNIYFKKMIVDIGATTPLLPFRAVDTLDNYKKFKVSSAFLEVPLELRFTSDPTTPNKTFKAAIGVKVGTMLNAHNKGKELRNASGTVINTKTVKETTKSYFNTTRVAATARVGYGNFSLFGAYSLTGVFKDGVAPNMNGLQVGLTFSGL